MKNVELLNVKNIKFWFLFLIILEIQLFQFNLIKISQVQIPIFPDVLLW
jgi:hypothetical protein